MQTGELAPRHNETLALRETRVVWVCSASPNPPLRPMLPAAVLVASVLFACAAVRRPSWESGCAQDVSHSTRHL